MWNRVYKGLEGSGQPVEGTGVLELKWGHSKLAKPNQTIRNSSNPMEGQWRCFHVVLALFSTLSSTLWPTTSKSRRTVTDVPQHVPNITTVVTSGYNSDLTTPGGLNMGRNRFPRFRRRESNTGRIVGAILDGYVSIKHLLWHDLMVSMIL